MLLGRVLALDPFWGSRWHQRFPSSFLRVPEAGTSVSQGSCWTPTHTMAHLPGLQTNMAPTLSALLTPNWVRSGPYTGHWTSWEGQLGMLTQPSWNPAMFLPRAVGGCKWHHRSLCSVSSQQVGISQGPPTTKTWESWRETRPWTLGGSSHRSPHILTTAVVPEESPGIRDHHICL